MESVVALSAPKIREPQIILTNPPDTSLAMAELAPSGLALLWTHGIMQYREGSSVLDPSPPLCYMEANATGKSY